MRSPFVSGCQYKTLLFTLFFTFVSPVMSTDDWVLTERYKSQLKDAQAGNALAMYEIGRMYERGRGIDQDIGKAAEWYQKAVDKNQNDARARLGILYLEGLGVERNVNKAAHLLATAAEAGISTAQFYLAMMFEHGDGMPRNTEQAMRWYKAAADGGYYQARARLTSLSSTAADTNKKPAAKPAPANKKPEPAAKPSAPITTAAVTPPTAPPIKEKPGETLYKTVLQGGWKQDNGPASFLPSNQTTCEKNGDLSLKCTSGVQERQTGAMIITYVLEATLTNFNASDQFNVEYVNNVLGTKQKGPSSSSDASSSLAFNVKLGKQLTVHKLNCELENENKVVCVKDKISTVTFTR